MRFKSIYQLYNVHQRFFGDFNGDSDNNYNRVWDEDSKSSSHTCFGVESVDSVMSRSTSLVLEIESLLESDKQWNCILVAHGDVLQITQTAFCKIDGSKVRFESKIYAFSVQFCHFITSLFLIQHRSLPHLDTAKIRSLEEL